MDVITSIGLAAADDPYLKDCSLAIDAMATKKEKVWDSHNHEFVGYLNYGSAHPIDDESEKMAKDQLSYFFLWDAKNHGSTQSPIFSSTTLLLMCKLNW